MINAGTFIRDVQITGDLAGTGDVYIAGMDEGGGGFPHTDTNYIFKSTDGGTHLDQHLHRPCLSRTRRRLFQVTSPFMFPDSGGLLASRRLGSACRVNGLLI